MTGYGDESAELRDPTDPSGAYSDGYALLEDPGPATVRGLDGAVIVKKRSEDTHKQRYSLAVALLVVTALFSIGAAALAILSTDQQWSRLDALVPLLLTPFQTLLGAAIGWYFGSQSKDKKG